MNIPEALEEIASLDPVSDREKIFMLLVGVWSEGWQCGYNAGDDRVRKELHD